MASVAPYLKYSCGISVSPATVADPWSVASVRVRSVAGNVVRRGSR